MEQCATCAAWRIGGREVYLPAWAEAAAYAQRIIDGAQESTLDATVGKAEQAEARAEKLAEALRDIIAPSGKSLTHQIEAEMRETARAALRDYEAVDSIHTPEIS